MSKFTVDQKVEILDAEVINNGMLKEFDFEIDFNGATGVIYSLFDGKDNLGKLTGKKLIHVIFDKPVKCIDVEDGKESEVDRASFESFNLKAI